MSIKIVLSMLICSITLVSAETHRGATNGRDSEILFRFAQKTDYDFFDSPTNLSVSANVMLQPKNKIEFETSENSFDIGTRDVDLNVSQTVESERIQNMFLRTSSSSTRIRFTEYQRYDSINAYLNRLAKLYRNRVKVKTIGKSYEKRDIKAITISNGDGKKNKNVIILEAGINAREWMAPASALYVIHELVENFNKNSGLLQRYEWIILPLVNPDGYEYSHTKNRMWLKNRKPVSGSNCYGTDLNRNFDFHWGTSSAFTDPCADTFKGKKAFSENESAAIRDLIRSLKSRIKFYLTLHSSSPSLLYPWAYSSNVYVNSLKDLDKVAQVGAAAIRSTTGTIYTVGSFGEVLHECAGSSLDYTFGVAGIPISLAMMLPGGSIPGSNPPPARIEILAYEAWIGIKAMAENVISKY